MDVAGMTDLGLGSAVIIQGFSLTALWLRLRWWVKQENAHREYLVALLRALPEGSEVDEQGTDGVKLTISKASRRGEADRA